MCHPNSIGNTLLHFIQKEIFTFLKYTTQLNYLHNTRTSYIAILSSIPLLQIHLYTPSCCVVTLLISKEPVSLTLKSTLSLLRMFTKKATPTFSNAGSENFLTCQTRCTMVFLEQFISSVDPISLYIFTGSIVGRVSSSFSRRTRDSFITSNPGGPSDLHTISANKGEYVKGCLVVTRDVKKLLASSVEEKLHVTFLSPRFVLTIQLRATAGRAPCMTHDTSDCRLHVWKHISLSLQSLICGRRLKLGPVRRNEISSCSHILTLITPKHELVYTPYAYVHRCEMVYCNNTAALKNKQFYFIFITTVLNICDLQQNHIKEKAMAVSLIQIEMEERVTLAEIKHFSSQSNSNDIQICLLK